LVLENEHLRATVAPELGGRLLSLIDKDADYELLDRNPVFQPANLALRNAWFSGGVEWNPSHFGHHYQTCSPVYAARVRGSRGEPVLRIYEWDRVKAFPWQVDFHLPPGARFLFTRVRLVNPHDAELPMYWWTNIAVPERARTRTICPVETALHSTDGKEVSSMTVPMHKGLDTSYAQNMPGAREFFFRIPAEQRKWVAALEDDGRGLAHVSTPRLRGRKAFYWGMNQGGRQWQEFLAAPGRAYLEIQAGLARTQMESVPMPANTQWSWTEAFGLIGVDPKKAHSANWNESWRTVDTELAARLPQAALDALDHDFAAVTARAADEVLATASGWGALERRRLAAQKQPDRIPAELAFTNLGDEQRPWLELLEKGALPTPANDADPGQLMTQPEWRDLLERAVAANKGDHWSSWYHLGNMRLENFDPKSARDAWDRSLKHRRTAWALRNLAILASREADTNPPTAKILPEPASKVAADLLRDAWEAGPRTAALAVEYARQLLQTAQFSRLFDFTRTLPPDMQRHERIMILSANAALEVGDLAAVEQVFKHDFGTIREGEVTLTDLWFQYHERRLAKEEKIPIDDALKARVRKEFPPSQRIDFRVIQEIN
jgi:hypothetical protein